LRATVTAVQDANAVLRRELVGLQAEALRDHDLLVADHDEFIAMLLTDHEREMQALREQSAVSDSD